MAKATYYYTANNITPNRCTITGQHSSRDLAEAAIEGDDESGVFQSSEDGLAQGALAYHRRGEIWATSA